jgi:integrase/recombinase XerD
MKRITTGIFLKESAKKQDETIPVKLRITKDRTRRYYPIPKIFINNLLADEKAHDLIYTGTGDYSLDKDTFNKTQLDRPRGKYAILRKVFDKIVADADKLIQEMEPFSFDGFREIYLVKETPENKSDMFSQFEAYILKLHNEERIGTADLYRYVLKSLRLFHKKKRLPFEAITVKFLQRYEKYLIENDTALTTVGIYQRHLRAIFNQRPEKLNIPNPYGKEKYQIPRPKGRKKALSTEELKKLFAYQPPTGSQEEYFLDVWKAIFQLNGLNVTDLLNLKWRNIEGGFIYFVRQKTKRTNNETTEIKIPYSDGIKQIFDQHGSKKEPGNYIFPVLNFDMNATRQREAIRDFTKQINKYVDRVAKKLEIETRVTTYVGRHSYATQLMRHGAPAEFISKQLGHSDIKTTNAYLAGFEDETLRQWQEKLTQF